MSNVIKYNGTDPIELQIGSDFHVNFEPGETREIEDPKLRIALIAHEGFELTEEEPTSATPARTQTQETADAGAEQGQTGTEEDAEGGVNHHE